MFLLNLASVLLFSSDVALLDDPDFAVRHAAFQRLRKADVSALPALEQGLRTAGPEARNRIEILVHSATTTWAFGAAMGRRAVSDDGATSGQVRAVASLAAVWPAVAHGIGKEADLWNFYHSGGAEAWARRLSYRSGTLAGEFELVATWARNTRMGSYGQSALDYPVPPIMTELAPYPRRMP